MGRACTTDGINEKCIYFWTENSKVRDCLGDLRHRQEDNFKTNLKETEH